MNLSKIDSDDKNGWNFAVMYHVLFVGRVEPPYPCPAFPSIELS